MLTRALKNRCRHVLLLSVLACCGLAPPARAQEGRPSIHPNPNNARLVWEGEGYLVWETSAVIEKTAARHLPSAVFRYYVQGHPSDVVPHVYEVTARLGQGARVLGVIGQEATLVLAREGQTVLVNTSAALGLPDPREAVTEMPAEWFEMEDGGSPIGIPLSAHDEGVLAAHWRGGTVYLIPWSPGRERHDARARLPAGDLRGMGETASARNVPFVRRGDLVVWGAGSRLHVFDFKTQTSAAHPVEPSLLRDPVAFDGELVVFTRHADEGPESLVYDAQTGRRLPGVFMRGVRSGAVLGMKGGVVYVLEEEKAADADGRFAWRVSSYDLKHGGRWTPLAVVPLKIDAERPYVHRLFYRDQLFFWNEGAWQTVPVNLDEELAAVEEKVALFRELRARRRQSGQPFWADRDLSAWGGKLHTVMGEVGRLFGRPPNTKAALGARLGDPDRVWTLEEMRNYLTEKEWAAGEAAQKLGRRREYLVYHWRGGHDFLYFVSEGGRVVAHGWYFAGE